MLDELGDNPRLVVEATYGWEWLVELLQGRECDVRLSHPQRTRAIATARIKTDRVDANTLAQLLRADFLPEALQGELLALRWRDVAFVDGLLHVRRNYTDGTEKIPKGKKVRSVPMTPDVVDALAKHKERGHLTADAWAVTGDLQSRLHRFDSGRRLSTLLPWGGALRDRRFRHVRSRPHERRISPG